MNNKNTTLFDLSHTQKSAWANSFGWHFKHFATHICNTFWWSFSNSFASNFPLPLPHLLPLLLLFTPFPWHYLVYSTFFQGSSCCFQKFGFCGVSSPYALLTTLARVFSPRSPPLRKSCHFSSFYALLCFLFSVLASPFWQGASVARVVVIRVVVVAVAGRGPLWLFLSPNFASIFHILLHFLLALAAHTK